MNVGTSVTYSTAGRWPLSEHVNLPILYLYGPGSRSSFLNYSPLTSPAADDYPGPNAQNTSAALASIVSIHAFTAKLSARPEARGNSYQLPMSLRLLRRALEECPWKSKGPPKGLANEGHERQSKNWWLGEHVPPAAQWILYAGTWIWRGSKGEWKWWEENVDWKGYDAWYETSVSWEREWKGELGFSLDRWRFWKERLQEISGDGEVDEATTRIAKEAVAVMRRLEEGA